MLIKKPQVFGPAVQVQLQLDKPSQKVSVQTCYSGTSPSAPVCQKFQHAWDIDLSCIIHSGKQGQYFPCFSKAVKEQEFSRNSAEGNQLPPFSQGADVQVG